MSLACPPPRPSGGLKPETLWGGVVQSHGAPAGGGCNWIETRPGACLQVGDQHPELRTPVTHVVHPDGGRAALLHFPEPKRTHWGCLKRGAATAWAPHGTT